MMATHHFSTHLLHTNVCVRAPIQIEKERECVCERGREREIERERERQWERYQREREREWEGEIWRYWQRCVNLYLYFARAKHCLLSIYCIFSYFFVTHFTSRFSRRVSWLLPSTINSFFSCIHPLFSSDHPIIQLLESFRIRCD